MDAPELYKDLVEQAPDAIIFADSKGTIQIWNSGAEALFGYLASEALGRSLDLIVPEDLRKAHWSGFDRAMKAGQTKYGRKVMPTRSAHKNGERIYVALSFAIVQDKAGNSIGAMAQAREITAQYLAEKAMRKRIAELEHKHKHKHAQTEESP